MEKLTSRRNPLAVHIKKLGAERSYRLECREFLCDGEKLLEEAVNCGAEITTVLTASHIQFPLPVDSRVYYTTRDIIDSISPLKNAQKMLFTCKMPPPGGFAHSDGTNILLDGIQDPGNLGMIIRTAEAFQIGAVILTGSCVDVYNPKTVRATMGAIFRQKIYGIDISGLKKLKSMGAVIIGAASGKNQMSIHELRRRDAIIAIGSEGHGLSGEVLSICDEIFTIPVAPECDSLNAAAAASIIMWELCGKLRA